MLMNDFFLKLSFKVTPRKAIWRYFQVRFWVENLTKVQKVFMTKNGWKKVVKMTQVKFWVEN